MHPALRGFRSVLFLDSDSELPAPWTEDPLAALQRDGLTAVFPYVSRDQSGVSRDFVNYVLFYCRLHGLDPLGKPLLRALLGSNLKAHNTVAMTDIEALDLDFFRGAQYQDFIRFLAATEGFEKYRWGDTWARTFGVALFADAERVRTVSLPYAHQRHCVCPGGPCAPRAEAATSDVQLATQAVQRCELGDLVWGDFESALLGARVKYFD